MLGKLGDLLNKDVGALVKDAGKVLNTDVSTLAKGAGKVLNADLGDLLRSTPATEKPADDAGAADAAVRAPAESPAVAAPAGKAPLPAAQPATPPVEEKFDPGATLQLRRPPALAAEAAVAPTPTEAATTPRLTDELVTRSRRPAPQGTSLVNLLPYAIGEFERPHATPAGELTSDPVTAIYRGGGDTIAVKLMQCWDNDEAIERLQDIKAQSGDNVRIANDHSWVLGQTAQGIVFGWNRDTYSFSATSPKGLGSLAKFLAVFPY